MTTTLGDQQAPAAPTTRKERRSAARADQLREMYEAQARAIDSGQTPGRDDRRLHRTLVRLATQWAYRQLRTRRAWRAARALGWDTTLDLEGMIATSQAGALDNALTTTRPHTYGPPLGIDHYTGQADTHSITGLYANDDITSPNVVVIGKVGNTKSTLSKTAYLSRALAVAGNRVCVFDRKRQRAGGRISGEYDRACQIFPSARIRLDRSPHGARINVLDPRIAETSSDEGVEGGVTGQDALLGMVAEQALKRPLNGYEEDRLATAHRLALDAARAEGRVAVIQDVVDAIYTPASAAVPGPRDADGVPVLTKHGIVTEGDVVKWGLELASALKRYLPGGDMSGLIDGETTGPDGTDLNLDAPLLVFDTSALPEGSDALAVAMAVASTYLMNEWARTDGHKTLILEEAYSASGLAAVGEIFRGLVKRSRGIGASVVSIFHHLSDVPETSPLWSVIREADVAHIFTQDKTQDAKELVAMFGLPDSMVEQIQTLTKGAHVLIRGRLPATIMHGFWPTLTDEGRGALRAPKPPTGLPWEPTVEQWLTYTDGAMEAA